MKKYIVIIAIAAFSWTAQAGEWTYSTHLRGGAITQGGGLLTNNVYSTISTSDNWLAISGVVRVKLQLAEDRLLVRQNKTYEVAYRLILTASNGAKDTVFDVITVSSATDQAYQDICIKEYGGAIYKSAYLLVTEISESSMPDDLILELQLVMEKRHSTGYSFPLDFNMLGRLNPSDNTLLLSWGYLVRHEACDI